MRFIVLLESGDRGWEDPMLAGYYRPDDDVCPVRDELLGQLYSASKVGLPALVATVPPTARAMLALFCYHRSHLYSLGLSIAASCEEDDLVHYGGRVGATLFTRSREAPPPQALAPHHANRRKITLATGPLRNMGPFEDEPEPDED